LSGRGIKQSEKFTTGPDRSLAFTYDCSAFNDGTVNELDAKARTLCARTALASTTWR